MKPKPRIDLRSIARINPEPLRKKLQVFRQAKSDITANEAKRLELQREFDDLVKSQSTDDAIDRMAWLRTRLELYPDFISKLQRQIDEELAPALLEAADAFRSEMLRFYDAAHAATAETLAELFRPYFADRASTNGEKVDRARQIAEQSDDCGLVMSRRREAELISLPSHYPRSNDPDRFDRTLCEVADALLALASTS